MSERTTALLGRYTAFASFYDILFFFLFATIPLWTAEETHGVEFTEGERCTNRDSETERRRETEVKFQKNWLLRRFNGLQHIRGATNVDFQECLMTKKLCQTLGNVLSE